MYRSQHDHIFNEDFRIRPRTVHGTREKSTYSPQYDKNGHYELVETGKVNTYDEIQSHKDSVDLKKILDRYVQGDTTVLSRVQGIYGDFSGVPTNYAEMLNIVIKQEADFNALPVEVRARFDHNFGEYMRVFGTDDWATRLGIDVAKHKREAAREEARKENDVVKEGAAVE